MEKLLVNTGKNYMLSHLAEYEGEQKIFSGLDALESRLNLFDKIALGYNTEKQGMGKNNFADLYQGFVKGFETSLNDLEGFESHKLYANDCVTDYLNKLDELMYTKL